MPFIYAAPMRGAVAVVRGRRVAAILTALVVAAVACNPSDALKVHQPDNVQPGGITSKSALPAVRNGAQAAFQIAYSGGADLANGGHEGHINMTGLLSDELQDQETFTSRIQLDARVASPGNQSLNSLFIDISSARGLADRADRGYAKFDPANPDHALVLNLGGYAYTLLAEDYCEGVPQSVLNDDGTITYGMPLSRNQLIQLALQHFDSALAIAQAAGDATNQALAQVGIGRALLDSNDDAAAAAAVAGVPTSFIYKIGASTNSTVENNGIWNYTYNSQEFGMSEKEGGTGLPFVSANDPRVPFVDTHTPGVDQGADFIAQALYPTQASPIPLAVGVEAQLIIAEHQLRTGDVAGWLTTLNAVRTTVPGLAPLADPGTQPARIDLLFRERAFWMYLTAHRLGDLRRLVRQYGRDPQTVFPSVGNTESGQPFSTDVNFPVPAQEQANPNFHGCTNRTA